MKTLNYDHCKSNSLCKDNDYLKDVTFIRFVPVLNAENPIRTACLSDMSMSFLNPAL